MAQKKFGYGRVSSKDQNEGRQVEGFLNFGIEERDIFIDKKSGKNFDREQYQVLKHMLREGDILYIHSLDRLGRNKQGILDEWNDITKNIKADIVVLDMPLLDTTKNKDSLGTFISDLVLQILSWIAEDERERINKRQREGIDLAMKNGVKLGRPEIQITDEFISAYDRWKAGEIKAVQAMNEAGLAKATFYRMVKKYEAGEG
ncbi:recombinase family protein [Priestia megaterium]|uniref:recombinase family protein n=1 Tax=Priestia megaterium TaxID=1404 RepID=UPI000BF8C63A|nr:recombinase family protein [Priestia megaterium]PFQ82042.1 DNA recombinase [Priestia megaterium]